MPQTLKVELYAAIRRDHRAGMKMRELERNTTSGHQPDSLPRHTCSALVQLCRIQMLGSRYTP